MAYHEIVTKVIIKKNTFHGDSPMSSGNDVVTCNISNGRLVEPEYIRQTPTLKRNTLVFKTFFWNSVWLLRSVGPLAQKSGKAIDKGQHDWQCDTVKCQRWIDYRVWHLHFQKVEQDKTHFNSLYFLQPDSHFFCFSPLVPFFPEHLSP